LNNATKRDNRPCPTFLLYTGPAILGNQHIIAVSKTIVRDLNRSMKSALKDGMAFSGLTRLLRLALICILYNWLGYDTSAKVATPWRRHWRAGVKKVIYRYLDCGDPHNGFARVRCKDCGHEYLLAFSCKRRHFCPSCHQKRVVEFGEWLCQEVIKAVPHRHFIFSIPKILRRYFLGACPGPDPGTAAFSPI